MAAPILQASNTQGNSLGRSFSKGKPVEGVWYRPARRSARSPLITKAISTTRMRAEKLLNMAVTRNPVGGLLRCARSFYELLGNRRKFERVPMSGPVIVTCKGAVVDTTHLSSCLDISPRGMAVECPEPLAIDGFVQVQSDDHSPRRMARVRYCIPRGDRYRAGLEFISEAVRGEESWGG